MSDEQVFALAVAIIVPVSVLVHTNSRIAGIKIGLTQSIGETKDTLRAEVQNMKEGLRGEMQPGSERTSSEIRELKRAFQAHELEHHK